MLEVGFMIIVIPIKLKNIANNNFFDVFLRIMTKITSGTNIGAVFVNKTTLINLTYF